MSDQDIISTCNINATSRRIINENLEVKGWIVWSFIRFYHGTKKPLSKGDERVSFPFRGPCKKNSWNKERAWRRSKPRNKTKTGEGLFVMNVSLCKSHLYLKVGRNESFSLNSRGKKMWIGPSYDAVKTYSSFAESCLILSVTSTIRLQPSRGIILPVEFPRFTSDFRRWQEIFQMAKIISYRLKRRTLHSFVYWRDHLKISKCPKLSLISFSVW